MTGAQQSSTSQIDEIDSDKTISESSDDELNGSRQSETFETEDRLANKLKASLRQQQMKIDIAAKQVKSYETEEEGIFTKANENSLGQIQNLADAAYGAAGRTFSNEEFSLKEEPEITLVTKKLSDSNDLHRS